MQVHLCERVYQRVSQYRSQRRSFYNRDIAVRMCVATVIAASSYEKEKRVVSADSGNLQSRYLHCDAKNPRNDYVSPGLSIREMDRAAACSGLEPPHVARWDLRRESRD